MGAPRRLIFTVFTAAALTGAADARPVTLEGVTFSDERGGFTIVAGSGTGSLADPFVIVEEITGPTAAVLVVRGVSPAFGNRVGTAHGTGFALRKVVTNRTSYLWMVVEFELQQVLGVYSDTLDGLSFAQGAVAGRPFGSDHFVGISEIKEPIDMVTFHDGLLRPGETAVFNVTITDTTPVPTFYLIQRPTRPIARADAGAPRRSPKPPW